MKQWPFAHTIEMTYRLRDGVLEVATAIVNLSAEPMPVAVGFHPYFQLTDSRRDDWTISVGARTRWKLAAEQGADRRDRADRAAAFPTRRRRRCATSTSTTTSAIWCATRAAAPR